MNNDLAANPALVNTDPYAGGWMIKIKPSDAAEFGRLLGVDDYLKKSGH